MSDYNYRHFPQDLEADVFAAFRDHLRVGQPAPDGVLVDAATGSPTSLTALRRGRPLVLEFGSLS